jgi:transcriptional regulator with XRE-family HTH domain
MILHKDVIKGRLRELGFTQIAFAHHIGINVWNLRDWLSGERTPSPEKSRLIADGIGMRLDEIATDTRDMLPIADPLALRMCAGFWLDEPETPMLPEFRMYYERHSRDEVEALSAEYKSFTEWCVSTGNMPIPESYTLWRKR